MEDIKKAIIKAKNEGNKHLVQRLQQELDALQEISDNLDWPRYEKALRKLEDKPDMEDFPDGPKKDNS